MRTQQVFFLTGMMAALMSGAAFVSTGHAQKGGFLQPETPWSVKNVNDRGANSYCAIARRFNDGVILTLAKNRKNETSLAVDFGKPSFPKNRTMRVTLDPGAGEQRSLSITPSSAQALVAKLGQDDKFHKAIIETGYLRADIDGTAYNFNLADIDKGHSQLRSCITPDTPQQEASGVSPATAPAGKVDELRSRVTSLETENLRLKARLASSEESPVESSYDTDAIKNAKKKIANLQRENAKLADVIDVINQEHGSDPQALLVRLAAENRALKEQVPQAGDIAGAKRELQNTIATLEKKNKELSNRLEEMRGELQAARAEAPKPDPVQSDAPDESAEEIEALKEENQALMQQLNSISTAAGGAALSAGYDQIESLEGRLERAQDQNAWLEKRIESLRDDKRTYLKQVSDYRAQVRELEKIAGRAQNIDQGHMALVEQLRQQIRIVELENEHLRAKDNEEAQKLRDSIAALEKENNALQKQLVSARGIADSALEEKIRNLQAENDLLDLELDRQAMLVRNEYEDRMTELREEINSLQDRLASQIDNSDQVLLLQERIANLQAQQNEGSPAQADKIKRLEAELAAASEQLAETERYKEAVLALKQQVDLLKDQKEMLDEKLVSLKSESRSFKELFDNSQPQMGEAIAEMEAEIAALTEENLVLKDELTEKLKNGTQVQEKVALLASENADLKERLRAFKDQAGALEEQRAENARLTERIAMLEANAEVSSAVDREEFMALKQENADLKAMLGAAQIQIAAYQAGGSNTAAKGIEPIDISEPAERPRRQLETREEKPKSSNNLIAAVRPQASTMTAPLPGSKPQGIAAQDSRGEATASGTLEIASAAEAVEPDQEIARQMNQIEPTAGQEGNVNNDEGFEVLGRISSRDNAQTATRSNDRSFDHEAQRLEARLSSELGNEETSISGPARVYQRSEDLLFAGGVDDSASDNMGQNVERHAGITDNDGAAVTPSLPDDRPVANIDEIPDQSAMRDMPAPARFQPSMPIEDILAASGVPVDGQVYDVSSGDTQTISYQWQSDAGLYGSAHQKPIARDDQFDGLVEAYLANTENRCPGDFAIAPSGSQQHGSIRIDSYEIACVGQDVDSSASLLFFNHDGTFTVVAHETETSDMGLAMDYRDRLVSAIKNS